jgi:hypothetical protein
VDHIYKVRLAWLLRQLSRLQARHLGECSSALAMIACDSMRALLMASFVSWQEHPPKKADATKPAMGPDDMQKGLRTAISHYHPVRGA